MPKCAFCNGVSLSFRDDVNGDDDDDDDDGVDGDVDDDGDYDDHLVPGRVPPPQPGGRRTVWGESGEPHPA